MATKPICVFFDMFSSSADPYYTDENSPFCHLVQHGIEAKECLGDYLKCPVQKALRENGIYIMRPWGPTENA